MLDGTCSSCAWMRRGVRACLRCFFVVLLVVSTGLETAGGATYGTTEYDEASGLPSTTIFRIGQDRDGVLWLMTRNGVVSYDGIRWQTFDAVATARLPGATHHWDADGTLWVFGQMPEEVWRFSSGEWSRVPQPDWFDEAPVASSVGPHGLFLAFGDGRLASYSAGKWALLDARIDDVSVLVDDELGRLIASGADVMALGEAQKDIQHLATLDDEITDLARHPDGRIFYATCCEFGYVDPGANQASGRRIIELAALDEREPYRSSLTIGVDGEVFIYDNTRLLRWTSATGVQVLGKAAGAPQDGAGHVFVDREGNRWFGSTRGLAKVSSFQIANLDGRQGLYADEVSAILHLANGSTVLGHPDGLSWWRDGNIVATHLVKRASRVMDLVELESGAALAAVENFGVLRLTGIGQVEVSAGAPFHAKALAVSPAGTIWVIGARTLHRSDDDGRSFQVVPMPDYDRAGTRRILVDEQDNLYLASMTYGLLARIDGKWSQLTHPEIGAEGAYTLLRRGNGELLLGTRDGLFVAGGAGVERHPADPGRSVFALTERYGSERTMAFSGQTTAA